METFKGTNPGSCNQILNIIGQKLSHHNLPFFYVPSCGAPPYMQILTADDSKLLSNLMDQVPRISSYNLNLKASISLAQAN